MWVKRLAILTACPVMYDGSGSAEDEKSEGRATADGVASMNSVGTHGVCANNPCLFSCAKERFARCLGACFWFREAALRSEYVEPMGVPWIFV